jgi:hypothetical protein
MPTMLISESIPIVYGNVFFQALDNCNQLVKLEPDSKWALYTKVLILKALDSQAHHQVGEGKDSEGVQSKGTTFLKLFAASSRL